MLIKNLCSGALFLTAALMLSAFVLKLQADLALFGAGTSPYHLFIVLRCVEFLLPAVCIIIAGFCIRPAIA